MRNQLEQLLYNFCHDTDFPPSCAVELTVNVNRTPPIVTLGELWECLRESKERNND